MFKVHSPERITKKSLFSRVEFRLRYPKKIESSLLSFFSNMGKENLKRKSDQREQYFLSPEQTYRMLKYLRLF